jgi:O-antigen/teichoic acid export membrane protein
MNSAWSPWAMLQMHEGKIDKLKSASRWYVLLFSCAIIVFLLICPELLWILGGDKYMEAKYVMPPAMIAVVPQFIYSLYIDAEIYLKVPKRIAIGTLIAAVLNLVLNFIFIPMFGYVAAAYTTLAGYLALFAFHYISVHKLGKGDWFNNRFNIMVIIASLAMIPVAVFLYTFNVIRYIVLAVVIVVVGILAYRFRKQLISAVSIFIKRKKKK